MTKKGEDVNEAQPQYKACLEFYLLSLFQVTKPSSRLNLSLFVLLVSCPPLYSCDLFYFWISLHQGWPQPTGMVTPPFYSTLFPRPLTFSFSLLTTNWQCFSTFMNSSLLLHLRRIPQRTQMTNYAWDYCAWVIKMCLTAPSSSIDLRDCMAVCSVAACERTRWVLIIKIFNCRKARIMF